MLKAVKNIFTSLHTNNRLFLVGGIVIVLYCWSFALPQLYPLVNALVALFGVAIMVDFILLFTSRQVISTSRSTSKMWSLGDPNTVKVELKSHYSFPVSIEFREEFPEQLQLRDFHRIYKLNSKESLQFTYTVEPKTRGEYAYGHTVLIVNSPLKLISRRYKSSQPQTVPCFPSIIQMRKYELMAFAQTATQEGIKKMRRLGHSYEFEQIKAYVQGDDIRSVNWKAT
ncbi:MAG: DUF58 domain-containing protein, partial [Bacteroidota bacterium]